MADLAQALSVIHDELHKGNVEKAHELVHRALGIEDGPIDPLGRRFYRDFDVAFNTACRKNNVVGAYVVFDHDNPDEPRQVRILTGGNLYALRLLKPMLAAGQHAIAAPLKPPAAAELFAALLELCGAVGQHHDAMLVDGSLHAPFVKAADVVQKYAPRPPELKNATEHVLDLDAPHG
jgi:hypothetical protein